MKCSHCGQSLGNRSCLHCQAEVLEESLYCHRCGRPLQVAGPEVSPGGEETDFSKRILCSDGNCIGVINEQGICKVCGKPYTGEAQ